MRSCTSGSPVYALALPGSWLSRLASTSLEKLIPGATRGSTVLSARFQAGTRCLTISSGALKIARSM